MRVVAEALSNRSDVAVMVCAENQLLQALHQQSDSFAIKAHILHESQPSRHASSIIS